MFAERLQDKFDTTKATLTATLLLFIVSNSDDIYIKGLMIVVCMAALIMPALQTEKITWLIIFLIFSIGNIRHYLELANHKFLYIYWSLAVFICLFTNDLKKYLTFNGRLLIGLSFVLALIWKFLSGDYLNGSFFLWTCLADARFTKFLSFIHAMPKDVLEQNKNAVLYMVHEAPTPYTVHLICPSRIYLLSQFFTYFGLLIELGVACLFLLPQRFRITRYRDYPLFLFIVVVYLIAPVWEFGSILSVLGMAQADSKRKTLYYMILFLLMEIYRIIFFHFL